MFCRCGKLIEVARKKLGLNKCKSCAFSGRDIGKKKGVMIYTHKTAPVINIMSDDEWTDTKKYFVPNGARSAVKNFSKNTCS